LPFSLPNADEQWLLLGYVNRAVELWDVKRGKRVHRWNTQARNLWHPTGQLFCPGWRWSVDAVEPLSACPQLIK